ncbi:MAG: hypothetical protein WCF90_06585 [Methanomicrobiales archaeon]
MSKTPDAVVIQMGSHHPARRAQGLNKLGNIKFGMFSDTIQADRKHPDNPAKASRGVGTVDTLLFDQIWLGSNMSGGVRLTQYLTAACTDNILDDFVYYGMDFFKDKCGYNYRKPGADR